MMLRVIQDAQRWAETGRRVALALVVDTFGSSPRKPGSLLAIDEQGAMSGSVSAGCIEGTVAARALDCLESGACERLRFTAGDEQAWAVGLTCGGEIDVFICPYNKPTHDAMAALARADEPFTYLTVIDSRHPAFGTQVVIGTQETMATCPDDPLLEEAFSLFPQSRAASPERADDTPRAGAIVNASGTEVFVCRYEPRPTLVCVGAVHIAIALTSMAHDLGYHTVIVDPRRAFTEQERLGKIDEVFTDWPQEAFTRLDIDTATAVCVLSHDAKIDVPALREALHTPAFYIGCIGSFKTLRERIANLRRQGVDTEGLARIYGPIGLYIGGNSPEEIALSTMAQINAVRYGRIAYGDDMPGRTLDRIPFADYKDAGHSTTKTDGFS